MDPLIYRINLDCLRKDSQAIINAKTGEANGRKIVFTLYEGRTPFFVPDGSTVIFRAKKPGGAVLYNNCVVDDGKIEYTITSQTVAEQGVFPCEIQIIGADEKVIYTPYITMNVSQNLYSDTEIESSNEFTALEEAIKSIPSAEEINSKYTKPADGIPKTDLAEDVQASLDKADNALQEHQSLTAYRTAAEQDIIDSGKQDKLIAGDNITISEDGKTISATGGGGISGDDIETVEADQVKLPSKLSELENDTGFITRNDISDKQDTITDLDTIRTGAAKGATALQEHQSLAAYRTAAEQDIIDAGKVDKVVGKGLSSNDFTDAAKAKVDAIPANPKYTDTVYDDTAVKDRLTNIEAIENVTLTVLSNRLTGLTYTAKYSQLLGVVFVRIYGTVNVDMTAGTAYNVLSIGSHKSGYITPLTANCNVGCRASVRKDNNDNGVIAIVPTEAGIKDKAVYISGFWFAQGG